MQKLPGKGMNLSNGVVILAASIHSVQVKGLVCLRTELERIGHERGRNGVGHTSRATLHPAGRTRNGKGMEHRSPFKVWRLCVGRWGLVFGVWGLGFGFG